MSQLAHVQFGDEDLLIASEHLTEVRREWIQVPEVCRRHRQAALPHPPHSSLDDAEGRAPSQHEQLAFGIAVDFDRIDVVGDVGDLPGPGVDHQLMVVRVVGDVAGDVLLLEPADAVLEARRAGNRPAAGERLRITQIWQILVAGVRLGDLWLADVGKLRHVGKVPGLGSGGDRVVRQHDDGCHVLQSDPGGFDGDVEGVGRRLRSQYRHRSLAVATEDREQQVGLFRLGRKTGRRPTTLHIDHDERKLGHQGQADGLALEGEARPAGSRERQAAGERGTDGNADTGDLVLGLERLHPEVLVSGQLMQDVRGGCDRVGAVEHGEIGGLPGSDDAPGHGGVAGHVGVRARRQLGRLDVVGGPRRVGREPEVPTGLERQEIGVVNLRPLRELLIEPFDRRLQRPVEQPGHQAEREEVLRSQNVAAGDAAVLHGFLGQRLHGGRDDPVTIETAVLQRVLLVPGPVEVPLDERFRVHDDRPVGTYVLHVRLQPCRIHRHEDVRFVAGGQNVEIGNLHLERRDAGEGPRRSADLGREARECGEVVAECRRGIGELGTRQLHAVTGVTRKANDDFVEFLLIGRLGGKGGSFV